MTYDQAVSLLAIMEDIQDFLPAFFQLASFCIGVALALIFAIAWGGWR